MRSLRFLFPRDRLEPKRYDVEKNKDLVRYVDFHLNAPRSALYKNGEGNPQSSKRGDIISAVPPVPAIQSLYLEPCMAEADLPLVLAVFSDPW
jgi:hypothetical protein